MHTGFSLEKAPQLICLKLTALAKLYRRWWILRIFFFKSSPPVTHRLVPSNLPFKCQAKQRQLKVGGRCPGGYSCPCLVVEYTEELISRTLLGLFKIRLLSQDRVRSQNFRNQEQFSTVNFCFNPAHQAVSHWNCHLYWRFPVLETTSICHSCNKSIRTKQANPSIDTAISMGNVLVCWI